MCVYSISSPETLSEDLTAYKAVIPFPEDNAFSSKTDPKYRLIQEEYLSPGTRLSYRIGEQATSTFDKTPGLYCYNSLDEAKISEETSPYPCVFVEVRIPAGTRIRRASTFYPTYYPKPTDVILTESLIPVKKC